MLVSELLNQKEKLIGKEVTVFGIAKIVRKFKDKQFIILSDPESEIQVVYSGKNKIKRFSILKVTGTLFEESRAPNSVEIRTDKLIILNEPEEERFDIWALKRMTGRKKIEYKSLLLRLNDYYKIYKIFSDVVEYFREFYRNKGYLEVFTPKIVKIGVESGAEVFPVLYFGKEAYLAQSPQLYKQMLMASGVKGVFEVGTYWRAEKSRTLKHVAEFRGLDVEINYIEDYNQVMDVLEDSIRFVFEKLNIRFKEIPRITFKDAVDLLEEKGIRIKNDLTSEAEKTLGEIAKENYDSDFVFITEFPWESRPFYTMRKHDNPFYTYSFDLLFKGLEVVSGAQREHRYSILVEQIREKGIKPNRMRYYLEMFKHGIPPHGGFGLGIDRFVKQLLSLEDIRDCILWPRDPDTLEP